MHHKSSLGSALDLCTLTLGCNGHRDWVAVSHVCDAIRTLLDSLGRVNFVVLGRTWTLLGDSLAGKLLGGCGLEALVILSVLLMHHKSSLGSALDLCTLTL